ncbi:coiled-coil domain-containing protein 18 [Pygocentrus nattereri]|uniref:coiled-coil domain-containing protein 18 n=1 Tax=Pygocentrus nattereri TaxID=42514 RepID=UPI0008147334|nr:coiled-coil domain-containing protein 18 [Pygocentrus nattereri]
MADQAELTSLDSLLLQLALDTRELSQRKDNLKRQIEICKSNIQEKKSYIDEAQKSLKKLEEEILQKRNTVKCYKENVKSLRGTSELLLQYEKTLESELERRTDSCNQDMKVFQERIENYKAVFQQCKEEYCKNPLAKKLLSFQAENEEIEKRIRAKEEQITAIEKELKDLQGGQDTCDSSKTPIESEEQEALPSESSFQPEADTASHRDLRPQGTETEQDDAQIEMEEKATENNHDQADGCDESNASQVGAIGSIVWTKHEMRCVAEQKQEEQTSDMQDCNMNTSTGSDVMEEMLKVMEVEDQQETERAAREEGANEGTAPSSPTRLTKVLSTPTFSLNSSPSTSPGHKESSEAPTFVFSLNAGPSTPGFSGFGCGFDVGSSQNEESPFTFTSPYFTNKRSPETKLPGFLFDELENHPEEVFPFSFSSKSPQPSSSTQEPGETGDTFPFSFNFGKF